MTRSLLRRSSLAAITIPLAITGATQASGGWFMSDGVMYSPGASGGSFFYDDTFSYSQIGLTGIKIFGNAGPVNTFDGQGNFAGNPITIEFRGINSETVAAGQVIQTDIDMFFNLDGGAVRVLNTFASYRERSSGIEVTGGLTFDPGVLIPAPGTGGQFNAAFVTSALPSAFGLSDWVFRMQFDFITPPNSFLLVSVPNSSVDLRVVPAPSAGVGMLLATGLVARRRRRS